MKSLAYRLTLLVLSTVAMQGAFAQKVFKDCPECPEMVMLPSGSFLMGSPPDPEPDPFSNEKPKTTSASEKPQHRVQIQSFAIGKYEVTQEQWYAVMGDNPSLNKGRSLPVDFVSWDDIQQFIAALNQKTGKKYRLPSESEWEYAARAGTTSDWSFGNDATMFGNYANIGKKTQAVGQKLPNAFGLFDMYGNVGEWVQDCWHWDYAGAPTDGSAWMTNCGSLKHGVRRGVPTGQPEGMRSASRIFGAPILRGEGGFRLARNIGDTPNVGATETKGTPAGETARIIRRFQQ